MQTRGGTETSISFGNYSPDTVLWFLFLRTSNQFVQWYTGTSCTIISVVFSLEHCPPCLQILVVSLKAVSTKQIIQQEAHELGLNKRVHPAEESAPQAVTVNESGPSRIRSSPYTTSAPGKQV